MSIANTPSTYYIDSPNAKEACESDRKAIDKHCKPERPQSEDEEKKRKPRKRKTGLIRRLGETTEGLDDLGKKIAGYTRDKRSLTATDGNAWMEDHCAGLWFTPSIKLGAEFEKELKEALEKIKSKNLFLMKDLFLELTAVAVEKAGWTAVKKVIGLSARTALKAIIGTVGFETGVLPIIMTAWTVYDVLDTSIELAKLAGTKGESIIKAIQNLADIDKLAEQMLANYKNDPHKAQADAMTLMAMVNSCTRARKCMLVPYDNTIGTPTRPTKALAQSHHGQGCCPGQTGHHLLPHSMVKGRDCPPGYDKGKAPTICMEGTRNNHQHGSHGMAHRALTESMDDYKKKNNDTEIISYAEAKRQAIHAVHRAGAAQCSAACLEKQLDAYYGTCAVDLKATAGMGGGGRKKEDPKDNEPDDGDFDPNRQNDGE